MLFLADAYLHQLDPFLVQFTDTLGIRYYGLAYAMGFVIAWAGVWWFAKTGRSPLNPKGVGDLMTYVIIGVLVGGRLGWAILYQHGAPLIDFYGHFPYWRLLEITGGGMASHGGMIGVILACWWYARRNGIPSLHLFDLGALACTGGLFLGRLANFVNGELWGRALPDAQQTHLGGASPWWSIKYPEEVGIWAVADDPRMAEVDALRDVIGGDSSFVAEVVERTRAGQENVVEVVEPLLTAYYPSQLIQALTDGPILVGTLALIWLRPRKPGVVGSWFLIVYGILRIASEQFRQPDEGVALTAGLSRGQLLSVLMVGAGVVCLAVMARRKVVPMGGLRAPADGDA